MSSFSFLSLSGLGVCVSGVWRSQSQPGAEEDGWYPEEHWQHCSPHLKLCVRVYLRQQRNSEVWFWLTDSSYLFLQMGVFSLLPCWVCFSSFNSATQKWELFRSAFARMDPTWLLHLPTDSDWTYCKIYAHHTHTFRHFTYDSEGSDLLMDQKFCLLS